MRSDTLGPPQQGYRRMALDRVCGCGDSGHAPESWCARGGHCVDCCLTDEGCQFWPDDGTLGMVDCLECGARNVKVNRMHMCPLPVEFMAAPLAGH